MLINGIKFACNTCVKGHRSSTCNHIERPLVEIRKKGRPVTQCSYCRDLRKTKQVHIKCTCSDKKNTATKQQPFLIQNSPIPMENSTVYDGYSMLDDYLFHNSSSLRFLEGQPKSPKRRPSKRKPQETTITTINTTTTTTALPSSSFEQFNTPMMNSNELDALLNNVLEDNVIPAPTGQSVVITITPLSSEAKDTISRIVTCYCGDGCICPGCFVHPNNYDALFNQVVSQPSSSSCSSDDEYDLCKY